LFTFIGAVFEGGLLFRFAAKLRAVGRNETVPLCIGFKL
jgi:hypothetical protein